MAVHPRLLISRTAIVEIWLTRSDSPSRVDGRAALRVIREYAGRPGFLRRLAGFLEVPESPSEHELWARIERELVGGRVRVEQCWSTPIPVQPGARREPGRAPEVAPELEPIHEDDRALFLSRHDRRVEPEQVLHFTHLIRALEGQVVTLRILADAYPGRIVHECLLGAAATRNGVHDGIWDIVATQGEHAGRRLPAYYGPCTIEIAHDEDRLRDEGRFELVDAVQRLTLDGFFHTGSAVFLPSRAARASTIQPAPLVDDDDGHEHLPSSLRDRPSRAPTSADSRDSIGVSLLAQVLATCGAASSDRALILVGHASARGGDALNDELARARADCVWALLTGDDQAYVRANEAFGTIADDFVILRHCARLQGWRCDPGDPRSKPDKRYRDAVRAFQDHYDRDFDGSLVVDGEVGPQTRTAFARVIESALATALGDRSRLAEHRNRMRIHGEQPVLACGERFAASRPDMPDIDDRRVEVLMFGPTDPVPANGDAIYEGAPYRFTELTLALADAPRKGVIATLLDWLTPDPPHREVGAWKMNPAFDADDPWDFLNAFEGIVNVRDRSNG